DSIQVGDHEIRIESDAEVEWLAGQTIQATGEVFTLKGLPSGMKTIRAQVRNATGEVFVQPFTLEASQ
ncbi:MAG: hypothetical protein KC917_14935, partial [Candidatus Omnitrophica bacterium]|nr:hypothetical protein [Candidatus Omnitrophota bacterium]